MREAIIWTNGRPLLVSMRGRNMTSRPATDSDLDRIFNRDSITTDGDTK